MYERLEATISGRVQKVMFRDFAQRKAHGLKLTGIVRNNEDGTVSIIAEGPKENLEQYVLKLHRGPLLAKVEGVAYSWKPATGEYASFTLSYD
ncbi:acylphosphatase [Patescibacteria group bacterium]|nr:acylphosphatase [Patescibacteria group bacterium]MBU1754951.1 acylphosphatase [Patescibacteria group bacterium]